VVSRCYIPGHLLFFCGVTHPFIVARYIFGDRLHFSNNVRAGEIFVENIYEMDRSKRRYTELREAEPPIVVNALIVLLSFPVSGWRYGGTVIRLLSRDPLK
jgi:hypothetical protein